MLADVFGLSYLGETKEEVTYISPVKILEEIFPSISRDYPLILFNSQIKTRAFNNEEVIAHIKLPYTDPSDPAKFASIHSNPPGIETEYPSILRRKFGKGEVIWVAGPLEAVDRDLHRDVFVRLIRSLLDGDLSFEVDAPKSIEVTMFRQCEHNRYIVNFLNFQPELPNIPVYNIKFRIKTRGQRFSKVLILPEKIPLDFEIKGDYLETTIPKVGTYLMLGVYYV